MVKMLTSIIEIDMLRDFANIPNAKLPVPNMLNLVGYISFLEDLPGAQTIVFQDAHSLDDRKSREEFTEYRPHCIIGSNGAKRVPGLIEFPQYVVSKNTTDSWEAFKELSKLKQRGIMGILNNSEHIIVTGVVTGICVKQFIDRIINNPDLNHLIKRIVVIPETVANLDVCPSNDECFNSWSKHGVHIINFDKYLKEFRYDLR